MDSLAQNSYCAETLEEASGLEEQRAGLGSCVQRWKEEESHGGDKIMVTGCWKNRGRGRQRTVTTARSRASGEEGGGDAP